MHRTSWLQVQGSARCEWQICFLLFFLTKAALDLPPACAGSTWCRRLLVPRSRRRRASPLALIALKVQRHAGRQAQGVRACERGKASWWLHNVQHAAAVTLALVLLCEALELLRVLRVLHVLHVLHSTHVLIPQAIAKVQSPSLPPPLPPSLARTAIPNAPSAPALRMTEPQASTGCIRVR